MIDVPSAVLPVVSGGLRVQASRHLPLRMFEVSLGITVRVTSDPIVRSMSVGRSSGRRQQLEPLCRNLFPHGFVDNAYTSNFLLRKHRPTY